MGGAFVIVLRNIFHAYFILCRNSAAPDRNPIQFGVKNLRSTCSSIKRKTAGTPQMARTPENVLTVKQTVV